ncbi:MAG: tetratricopeptide repeat protein, partial [Phycisphaerae bacterium]
MLAHVRRLLGVAIFTAPALAGPLSTGEWLVHLGRDYPLSAQASLTNADAHMTLLLMQAAGRVEPALPEAWYWQADLLFALDQPDQARAALAEYVRRAPDDVAAHLRLIERATDALQTAEERAVAWRQSLKDAAALPREVRSDLHRRLAEFHANRGERQQALAEAQAALADFGMNFAARQLLDQLQGVEQTPAWRLEWALAEMVVNPADAAQAVAIGDLLTTLGLAADAEFWYG